MTLVSAAFVRPHSSPQSEVSWFSEFGFSYCIYSVFCALSLVLLFKSLFHQCCSWWCLVVGPLAAASFFSSVGGGRGQQAGLGSSHLDNNPSSSSPLLPKIPLMPYCNRLIFHNNQFLTKRDQHLSQSCACKSCQQGYILKTASLVA